MKQVFDNRFYDACFAAVWEYLEGRGLTENTVTIVTSDHGLSFGEQGERAYLHAGARPHEYMTRVPLVIRFPGQSELSRLHGTYRQQVSLTDLFLTMVELGVGPGVFERSEPIRGRSLVERLLSKDFEPVLVAEASMVPGTYTFWPRVAGYSKAIYSGPMKLIFAPELRRVGEDLWPVSARLSGKWPFPGDPPFSEKLRQPLAALYDLSVDPHERRNLASRRPAEVARLRALFPGSWSCEARPWGGPSPDWDEEALETLRSLGYVH
jgi:arylsulfatase A-like enzyme